MESQIDQSLLVSFGEVLLDRIDQQLIIGGAPLNVAYHLKQIGNSVAMISAIGKDENGKKLHQFMLQHGIDTTCINQNEQLDTGLVNVNIDAKGEIKYDIVNPSAWDFIEINENHRKFVMQSKALIYGTLSCRGLHNRKVLSELITLASFRVFDVNLRPPFVDLDFFEHLIFQANLVKFNSEEIFQIARWYQFKVGDIYQIVTDLIERFGPKEIIVTNGKQGAIAYLDGKFYQASGISVKVQDTIGCGDSFLSGYLSKRVKGNSIDQALTFAIKLSAFIASKQGGCPSYSVREVNL